MRKTFVIGLIILSTNSVYANSEIKGIDAENELPIRHEIKFGIGDEFYDVNNGDIYDEKQGGEFEINFSRLFTNNTKCSLTFSITEHEYSPKALLRDDILFSPGTSCSYLF